MQNPEIGIMVGLGKKSGPKTDVNLSLEELRKLAQTLGIEIKSAFFQRLDHPDTRTFVGKGKLEEIKSFCEQNAVGVVLFDDSLTATQFRNLENELQIKIYDRSLLILDIFMKHARSAQAKTQVELARYQYLLPRLTRMWTHLERQRGGVGMRSGAGEKEIETDKRIIRNRITRLKDKLKAIETRAKIQRKARSSMPRVALVGYTNAGKSTLMKLLSKQDVLVKDQLFATLDTTVRRMVLGGMAFLISDTVGFIRNLPHDLVESFRSTFAEVREADILIHVIDVSDPSFLDHMDVLEETLGKIDASAVRTLKVFNKIDLLEVPGNYSGDFSLGLSAESREGLDELRRLLTQQVKEISESRNSRHGVLSEA